MTPTIVKYSTASTNRDAVELAERGAVHGTAVIAETQTMGRGRLGKVWSSPPGKGLYCSIVIRPRLTPEQFPHLTFVAGLAVAKVIHSLYQLEPGLKWPNDIYFNMRKCGGILTESSSLNDAEADKFAVVGIGLNVNTRVIDFDTELQNTATSLYIESGREMPIGTVFQEIRTELLRQTEAFELYGFAPVIARWRKRDFLLGQRLAWVSVAGTIIEGISLGPDDTGRLHVRDEYGKVHEVLSGDIRLLSPGGEIM